jgi:hypothetical protein
MSALEVDAASPLRSTIGCVLEPGIAAVEYGFG